VTGGVVGAVLVWTGLVWWGGLGVFALACRLSATEPRGYRDARRIAAWQRASPRVLAACSLLTAVGVVLLVVHPQ
jgi:putative copper export protein